MVSAIRDQEAASRLVEKLIEVAKPGSVYSEPVTVGEHTIITASEVTAGGGIGFGLGVGSGSMPGQSSAETGGGAGEGGGGGGGGGAGSAARPVAVISIGPEGVHVEPVVDVTKLGLAVFTALGSMFLMFRSMARSGR